MSLIQQRRAKRLELEEKHTLGTTIISLCWWNVDGRRKLQWSCVVVYTGIYIILKRSTATTVESRHGHSE